MGQSYKTDTLCLVHIGYVMYHLFLYMHIYVCEFCFANSVWISNSKYIWLINAKITNFITIWYKYFVKYLPPVLISF